MDSFFTVVGGLQVVGQCDQITTALARYINQVTSVDERITSFYENVSKLRTTYEALEQSFTAPQIITAARMADKVTGDLWANMTTTLRDCENTLVSINFTLGKINRPLGLGAAFKQMIDPPLKQLQEQLNGGELSRNHDKVKMFNTSMLLPMQVVNITLQLSQRELSQEHQRRLNERLNHMQRTIESLHANIAELRHFQPPLRRPSLTNSASLAALIDTEKAVCEHMESFAQKASQFLSSASASALAKSGATVTQAEVVLPLRLGAERGATPDRRQHAPIEEWVPGLLENSTTPPTGSESLPSSPTALNDYDSDGADFELDLVRTFFQNGHTDLEQKEFASAEENFTEALKILLQHDFDGHLAFQTADVVLLLARCYLEQDKLDQAISYLLPLTQEEAAGDNSSVKVEDNPNAAGLEGSGQSSDEILLLHQLKTPPDQGRVLAAHHALGIVYVRKKDFENAEKHSLLAFKGRWKHFDKRHEKTLESARLVVDMYHAKGERAKARAYGKYLNPEPERRKQSVEYAHRPSASSQIDIPSPLSPMSPVQQLSRRQNQSLEKVPTVGTTGAPQIPPLSTSITGRRSSDLQYIDSRVSVSVQPPQAQPTLSRSPFSPHSYVRLPQHRTSTDNVSTVSTVTHSSTRRTPSASSKQLLKPRFDDIRKTAISSRDKACDAAYHLLKSYDPDPSKILIHRWDDIKKNIRRQGAEKGLASTGSGYAPIHFFCDLKDEYVTEVELLLEAGVDLTATKYKAGYGKQEPMTPLQIAIDRGHQILAAIMIEHFQDWAFPVEQINQLKDRDDFAPLLAACRRGQINTVSRLLDYGTSVSTGFPRLWCGNSLLHDTCSRGDVNMVKFLLNFQSRTVDSKYQRHDIGTMDQQDQFGRTPLMYAVISKNITDQSKRDRKLRGRYALVEALLEFGESTLIRDMFKHDNQKMDVFGYAADEGDLHLIDLLDSHARRTKAVEMA